MQDDCGISIASNSNSTTFVPSYANYNCKFMANYTQPPFILLYISNSQSIATPSPFQQMIQFSPSTYAQYENSNLGNIRFYQGSKELYSWCESGCSNSSSQATFWINLPSGVPANSVITVKMRFEPPSTNYDGVYDGEAGYGKYDNGAHVFPYYQSWAGLTALPSNWSSISGTNITYTSTYTEIAPSSSTSGWYGVYLNPIPSSLSSAQTVLEMYGNIYDSIQIHNHIPIPIVYNPTSYNGSGYVIFSQNTQLNGDIIAYNVTIDSGVTLTTNGYSIICVDNFINDGTINTGPVNNGGGFWNAPLNFPNSYGGSGGGGPGDQTASGEQGSSTEAPGGSGGSNPNGNGGNGSTPPQPTLNNSVIQTWYNNRTPSYNNIPTWFVNEMMRRLMGGGGGIAWQQSDTGGSGGYGIYIQANNITAGTIYANGYSGITGKGNVGTGGGGGGTILLAYGNRYNQGNYNVTGGRGTGGPGGGTGGNGGNGQVLLYHYTTPPITTPPIPPVIGSIVLGTGNVNNQFHGYSFSEGNITPNLIYLGNDGDQFYASTSYKDTNNNKIYTMQMNSPTSLQMFINYSQIYSTTSAVAENPTYFGIYTNNNGGSSPSSPVYIYWIRARAYPPNGVMPSVGFSNLQ